MSQTGALAADDAARTARGLSLPALAAGAYVLILIALTALVTASAIRDPASVAVLDGPSWMDAWFHRDAGWYRHIAAEGYFYVPGQQSSVAFFPSYPLAMRGVSTFTGDTQTAGWIVAVLAALAFVVIFARWVESALTRRAAFGAVALVLLYPFAFYFYGTVYSDSLFVLASIIALRLMDRGHALAAGLVGIVATAGRPVGLALTAALVVRAIELRALGGPVTGVSLRDLVRRTRELPVLRWLAPAAAGAVSVLGLLAWCLYLQVEYGDALAWVHVQEAWGQTSGPQTWVKKDFFGTLVNGPMENVFLLVPQAVCALFAVLALRRVQRLFGWGYAVYAGGVLAIAIVGTKDFMGCGRYALAAFPAVAAMADYLASKSKAWLPTTLGVSATGLMVAAFYFSRGYAVS